MSDIEMRGGGAVPPVIEFPHIITVVPVGPVGSICISHLETFEVVLTTECKAFKEFKVFPVVRGPRAFKDRRVLREQMAFEDHKGREEFRVSKDQLAPKGRKVRKAFEDQPVRKALLEFRAPECLCITRGIIEF
jgi:hypothetical protein